MSDRPIQVGDLVVVMGACCDAMSNKQPRVGGVYSVTSFYRQWAHCEFCGTRFGVTTIANLSSRSCITQWLKRIPPLEELEGQKEEMKEPA